MKKKIIIIIVSIISFFVIDWIIAYTLNLGLDRYFGLNQKPEAMFIGHSQLMLSVDKQQFEKETGVKVSKYCREGVNVTDRKAMIEQVLNSGIADSLKYVLYGVDQFMFNGTGLSANSYKLFYPFMDNKNMDKYIKESSSFPDYLIHKLIKATRYSDAFINSSIRGWRNDWSNYKYGEVNIESLKDDIKSSRQRHIVFNDTLKNDFEESLRLLNSRGIHVILVGTPVVDILNDYEPDKYAEIQQYFKGLDNSSPLISYWDLNPEFSDKHELFFDPIHLNVNGQQDVSQELSKLFNQLTSSN